MFKYYIWVVFNKLLQKKCYFNFIICVTIIYNFFFLLFLQAISILTQKFLSFFQKFQ